MEYFFDYQEDHEDHDGDQDRDYDYATTSTPVTATAESTWEAGGGYNDGFPEGSIEEGNDCDGDDGCKELEIFGVGMEAGHVGFESTSKSGLGEGEGEGERKDEGGGSLPKGYYQFGSGINGRMSETENWGFDEKVGSTHGDIIDDQKWNLQASSWSPNGGLIMRAPNEPAHESIFAHPMASDESEDTGAGINHECEFERFNYNYKGIGSRYGEPGIDVSHHDVAVHTHTPYPHPYPSCPIQYQEKIEKAHEAYLEKRQKTWDLKDAKGVYYIICEDLQKTIDANVHGLKNTNVRDSINHDHHTSRAATSATVRSQTYSSTSTDALCGSDFEMTIMDEIDLNCPKELRAGRLVAEFEFGLVRGLMRFTLPGQKKLPDGDGDFDYDEEEKEYDEEERERNWDDLKDKNGNLETGMPLLEDGCFWSRPQSTATAEEFEHAVQPGPWPSERSKFYLQPIRPRATQRSNTLNPHFSEPHPQHISPVTTGNGPLKLLFTWRGRHSQTGEIDYDTRHNQGSIEFSDAELVSFVGLMRMNNIPGLNHVGRRKLDQADDGIRFWGFKVANLDLIPDLEVKEVGMHQRLSIVGQRARARWSDFSRFPWARIRKPKEEMEKVNCANKIFDSTENNTTAQEELLCLYYEDETWPMLLLGFGVAVGAWVACSWFCYRYY